MRQKGLSIKNSLLALERLHGTEGVNRVKRAMPPRLREMLDALMPLEWYPVELTAAFHSAIRDVLGAGNWDESHRISSEAAKIELGGVYRLLLRAVQYDTVWDRMERAWSLYNDAGGAQWVDRGRGHATALITGVAGFNQGMWNSVAGRIEQMLLATGAKGASASVKEHTSTNARIEALWLE